MSAHLVGAIVLTGMALFWGIMVVSLKHHGEDAELGVTLGILNRSRWPHVVVPWKLRLPLPIVSWVVILVMIVTGGLLMREGTTDIDGMMIAKLLLVLLIAVVQLLLTKRPTPAPIFANLALVLAVVVLSGLILR
jgi:hypothetical protein